MSSIEAAVMKSAALRGQGKFAEAIKTIDAVIASATVNDPALINAYLEGLYAAKEAGFQNDARRFAALIAMSDPQMPSIQEYLDVSAITHEESQLIEQAIEAQGENRGESPSQGTLSQLGDFARAGRYQAFSQLYLRHRAAFPDNADFIEARVTSKILNSLVLRVGDAARVREFENANPQFKERLLSALQAPRLFDRFMGELELRLRN